MELREALALTLQSAESGRLALPFPLSMAGTSAYRYPIIKRTAQTASLPTDLPSVGQAVPCAANTSEIDNPPPDAIDPAHPSANGETRAKDGDFAAPDADVMKHRKPWTLSTAQA